MTLIQIPGGGAPGTDLLNRKPPAGDPQAPAVEVRSRKGLWVAGYRLLQFRNDGLAAIYSERTGRTEHLPQHRWRDPLEAALLASLAGGMQ